MTTAIINYPLRELSEKNKKKFLYKDPRGTGKMKGRTLRLRYPLGGKSALITFSENGTVLHTRCSLFGAISGQNVITHPNLPMAIDLTFNYLTQRLQQECKCDLLILDKDRDISLVSVDLVWHFRLGSRRDVTNMLAGIFLDQCKKSEPLLIEPAVRRGGHETVKISFLDPKVQVKFYDKFSELQQSRHRLPRKLPDREQLTKLTENWIRMEVTLSTKYLEKHNLVSLKNWTSRTRRKIFDEVLQALQFDGEFETTCSDPMLKKLSNKLQRTYLLWKSEEGFDDYAASTLAEHKKELRRCVGIDIDSRPPARQRQYMAIADVFSEERRVVPTKEQLALWVPRWSRAPAEGQSN